MKEAECTSTQQKVAIVIPWFGRDLRGGAELHAWELATRLTARGLAIEVLTTCCRAHQDDWATNHFDAGLTSQPEGFAIRRFPVIERDRAAFDQVNARLMATSRDRLMRGVSPLTAQEEEVFVDELIRSPALLDFLRAQASQYTAFLFLPYLYFSTIRGLPLVADRAILVPCLHHESYAFLPSVADAFLAARRILYLAEGEAELAHWLFGPGIRHKGQIAGAGVEFAPPGKGGADEVAALQPYVLCLGRQEPGKNTNLLAQAFAEFIHRHPQSRLKLVLAGPGSILLPADSRRIIDRGLVSEEEKSHLLAGCEALFAPSANESYSRVLMESWYHQRPAVVHGGCLATSTAVQRSGGGWTAGTIEEWIHSFARVDSTPVEELHALGRRGFAYLGEVASWDTVIARYIAAINELRAEPSPKVASERGTINQVLSNLAYGDAISNEAIWIKRALQEDGFRSEIFALDVHDQVRGEARPWTPDCLSPTDAVIYHHSIGSSITAAVCRHTGPKALIYHNITPHRFFAPFLPLHERLCREGREHLPDLADHFRVSAGDSAFNSLDLAEHGFSEPSVLPLCINPAKWHLRFDPSTMEQLQDGRTNVLFVGRLCPNKRQEHLIAAFAHFVQIEPDARLHLTGTALTRNDAYEGCLRRLVHELGLDENVIFAGHVNDAQLAAYYASAHLFWSMSEHEGFCIPLVEAMWFDVPVFAFGVTAVPETLATAGLQFTSKDDLADLARTAHTLVHDAGIRREVISRQRERRIEFLPDRVRERLLDLVRPLLTKDVTALPEAAHHRLPDPIAEVGIIALGSLEELLPATAACSSLRRRFPKAHLSIIVSPGGAALLEKNPNIDRIVSFDAPWLSAAKEGTWSSQADNSVNGTWLAELAARRFDLVVNLGVDLHSLVFAASLDGHALLSCIQDMEFSHLATHPLAWNRKDCHVAVRQRHLLALIGAESPSSPQIHLSAADDLMPAFEILSKMTVVLAPGASNPVDRWPTAMFADLARRLRTDGYRVVVIGSKADARRSAGWAAEFGCTNWCDELTFRQIAAGLSRVGCLIANHGPYMALGVATGIPVVGILRPPVALEFGPAGPLHAILAHDSCTACNVEIADEPAAESDRACSCIRSIPVEEVASEVRRKVSTQSTNRHDNSARIDGNNLCGSWAFASRNPVHLRQQSGRSEKEHSTQDVLPRNLAQRDQIGRTCP